MEPRDIKSYTAAGPDIRKVWMIRGCQHSQIAALLTASTTSLVWPSSAVPPLLNAKWKTANRDYWGEVPCRHGDKRSLFSLTFRHARTQIRNSSLAKAIWRTLMKRRLRQKWIFYTSSVAVGLTPEPEPRKLRTSSKPVTSKHLQQSKKIDALNNCRHLSGASFKDHNTLSAPNSCSIFNKALT